jgi:hypothetical protein
LENKAVVLPCVGGIFGGLVGQIGFRFFKPKGIYFDKKAANFVKKLKKA